MNYISFPRRVVCTGALVLALLAGCSESTAPDPDVVKAQEISEQLSKGGMDMPVEKRESLLKQMFSSMKNLKTREQKREFGMSMMNMFKTRAEEYFDMTENEKAKHIDDTIDLMESAMALARMLGMDKNRERSSENQPDRDENDRHAERMRRFKEFLDDSSPPERAMMGEYWGAIRKRRKERGLPEMGQR